MKNLLFFLFLCFTLPAQELSWYLMNPKPTSYDLKCICFADSNYGWMAGEMGTIAFTDNGGLTWTIQQSGTTNILTGIYFINQQIGYAVGYYGIILKTTNSGNTWISINSGTTNHLRSITFSGDKFGMIAGDAGTIITTTDGGINWNHKTTPTQFDLNSVTLLSDYNAVAVGAEGTIITTGNLGNTWEQKNTGTDQTFLSVDFDSLIGFAVGIGGVICKSTDGGNVWQLRDPPMYFDITSVYMLSPAIGMLGGDLSDIRVSTNGGLTWRQHLVETFQIIRAFAFRNDHTGFGIGDNGIIIGTTNKGEDWNLISGVSEDLYSVSFINKIMGITVGGIGRIMKTTNGGTSFNASRLYGYYLSASANNGVCLFNQNLGILISGGQVYRTTTGGNQWLGVNGYSINLFDICIMTETSGIIVGIQGDIFKTTDSGISWTVRNSPTTNMLLSVSFSDSLNGIIVGSWGTILRTTDGGESWYELSGGTTAEFYGVDFINNTTAIICGEGGTILRTSDGGNNWSIQTSGSTLNLRDVDFYDDSNGVIVGDEGTILRTTDGGITWFSQYSGVTNILYGASFPSPDCIYAAGEGGVVLKYYDGVSAAGEINTDKPSRYSLNQNFPNPFNSSTIISYSLPEAGYVKLIVYDILGREVKIIYDGDKEAGTHTINFNASGLSSGIYLYRLSTNNFSETRKMILNK